MERGPMALFGAIVAIGLGPAMWLGVQFGEVTVSPERPPAVTSEQQQLQAPRGGSGAGDAPTDAEVIRSEPKSNTQPLTRTKNARPVVTKSPSPSGSAGPSTPPVESGSPKPSDPGGNETDPPTGPTSPPNDPPPGDDDPVVPPQPPAVPQSDAVADTTSLV